MCERFLGSVRRECLDHLLISSERQLYRVLRGYVEYFNRARPHQGLNQKIPEETRIAYAAPATNKIILFPGSKEKDAEQPRSKLVESQILRTEGKGKIIAFPVLNGLHHDYRRVA